MRAVITGGTRGIGLSAAAALGKAGYDIIITGIDKEASETALKKLEDNGIKGEFIYADSMSEEDVNRCFREISRKYDSLDVLVNNVGGLGGRQRFEEMETSFMRRVMALNFDSAFFASRAAIPLLKKGSHPSIINYSTIAVTSGGGPGAGIYSASKAAVEGLTRALAKDLAEYGHQEGHHGDMEGGHRHEALWTAGGSGVCHRIPGLREGFLPHRGDYTDQRRAGIYLTLSEGLQIM